MRPVPLALYAFMLAPATCQRTAPSEPPPAAAAAATPAPAPGAPHDVVPAAMPGPGRPAATGTGAAAGARVVVTVTEDGWVPNRISAKAGQPLTLAITRKTEKTCATEIMFTGQVGKTDLPLGKTVEVVYTPKSSGDVKFGCAMGMMIGGVIKVTE